MDHTLDLWLEGVPAGQLHRTQNGQVEFIYSDEYLQSAHSPVSLSMPKTTPAHGPQATVAWLENLLPETVAVRRAWARHFGEGRTDAFTLLRHMGLDAPGAVQIVPEGVAPEDGGEHRILTEGAIAARVARIRQSRQAWSPDPGEVSRFSLAGQQAKFALTYIDGQWFEPTGRSPSTHILKPGIQAVEPQGYDDQVTELLTMKVARAAGLNVAEVQLAQFEDTYAFVTTRYDRARTPNGTIARVHQEDMCQALTVAPEQKYRADGGPSLADGAALISSYSTVAGTDRRMFAQVVAYNFLVAGVDCHAKNYSLLLAGDQVRLAPFYDLISAYGLLDEPEITHKATMAMRYGKQYRVGLIGANDLAHTADAIAVSRDMLFSQVHSLAEQLGHWFAQELDRLPPVPISDRVRRLPQTLQKRADKILAILQSGPPDLPAWRPESQLALTRHNAAANVWVPGYVRGDTWVGGHYQHRPRA